MRGSGHVCPEGIHAASAQRGQKYFLNSHKKMAYRSDLPIGTFYRQKFDTKSAI
jgi:hypothetical protein